MRQGYRRPPTPAAVERALRQEAGFGCARCGHPYIEYHHIIPYSVDPHFRPEDMVALCGNCHSALAKLGTDIQYKIKREPYNIKTGTVNGALCYDKRDLEFVVGGNQFINVSHILKFHNIPIISCRIEDSQARVSINIFDKYGNRQLSVDDNNIVFRVHDFWDFEYRHNLAIARYGAGDIAIKMDFRKPEATIEAHLWLGGRPLYVGKEKLIYSGSEVGGNTTVGGFVGIQLGNPAVSPKNYVKETTKRLADCPCGSGKRFKACHGAL